MSSLLNDLKKMESEFIAVRRDIHAHPELAFEESRTSQLIANLLKEWGIEVHTGIGKTGIVGVLRGSKDTGAKKRAIGIRADMDALPMEEKNDLAYCSTVKNCMHACGHDGHTSILLYAAKYLSQNRDFEGTVNFIFQPAEEVPPGGAKAMIADGFFERFPCDEVYALHNRPGLELGKVAFTKGAGFASSNRFAIRIKGKGGHAASPQNTIDPIVIASEMVMALQTVISRHKDPDESALLSVTQIHAGSTDNIIPNEAMLGGTVRTFNMDLVDEIESNMRRIVETLPKMHGGEGELEFTRGYPVLVNSDEQTDFAIAVAQEVLGDGGVVKNTRRSAGSEDFAYFLQQVPGTLFHLGITTKDGYNAGLHNPYYNFNDEALHIGAALWVGLVQSFFEHSK